MSTEISPFNPARERLLQMRAVLLANDVPKPIIIWIHGSALLSLLASIGKERFAKDGPIFHDQLYRFNLDTGRFRRVEPRSREV